MKLQFQGQHLRLRIDEAELAALRAGEALANVTVIGGQAWEQNLHQTDAVEPSLFADGNRCSIGIPKLMIDAYAGRLPCREGLQVTLRPVDGTVLDVVIEVDVRDSIRSRGLRRA